MMHYQIKEDDKEKQCHRKRLAILFLLLSSIKVIYKCVAENPIVLGHTMHLHGHLLDFGLRTKKESLPEFLTVNRAIKGCIRCDEQLKQILLDVFIINVCSKLR